MKREQEEWVEVLRLQIHHDIVVGMGDIKCEL